MKQPYADEAPMRRVGPLLVLLLAGVAVVLAAIAALSQLWNVHDMRDWPHQRSPQGKAPALETAPQPALQDYLAQKQHMANSYSWIDPAQHLARIPIEAAMRALASQSGPRPDERSAYLMGVENASSQNPGKDAARKQLQRAQLQHAAAPGKGTRTEGEP